MPPAAYGQIFVTNQITGTVGEYGLDGTAINASLAPNGLHGIAVSGQDIYVADSDSINEYTTSGAVVSAPLVASTQASGLDSPYDIAISGSSLFVTDAGPAPAVDEFTTAGAKVAAPLVTGFGIVGGIAVSGSHLFVASFTHSNVGVYTTSGAVVNASLIPGLGEPAGIAISGSELFVVNGPSVGEYTLAPTYDSIISSNPSFISGLDGGWGVAVYGSDLYVTSAYTISEYDMSGDLLMKIQDINDPLDIAVVPEPATGAIAAVAGLALLARRPRRRVG
jgi:hypothetical protein